ncbi:unnamed protein product [Gulo gulo]|uniref:Uncharacterized protein n=1 Tax=Gulo gulo TaxID=48420 RepID=A0A9X9PV65_GULGU|nr:unnamed protein product [Gulo gulo]
MGGPARSEYWPLPASPGASPSGAPRCPNSSPRWGSRRLPRSACSARGRLGVRR